MIRVQRTWFKDEHDRVLILRGVNLGGSTKMPWGMPSHVREGFYDHRNVSFVGRPFPLKETDEHLSRLGAWGFTFLRFLVTWEAIEHAGPGVYDEEYLDYLVQVVQKANEHGIQLFIDPHQDTWSRLSGGDGAPGWTFEAVGMDVTRFSETGAAIVHAIHGDPFPRMVWPSNCGKLAAATMFTLFFGGDDFAPRTKIDGEPAQGYLQRHYIEAVKQVAHRLKDLPNVVGYDTLNEPSSGFIGQTDLQASGGPFRIEESPTLFQAMLLGAGFPQQVEVWKVGTTGFRRRGRRLVNPRGARVWREGCDCVWKENGVWDVDGNGSPRLLRPDHFAQVGDRPVDFAHDYLRPFANLYAREIRSVDPDALIFVEGEPVSNAHFRWGVEDAPNVVSAEHWYDGMTLFTKNFSPFVSVDIFSRKLVLGRKRVQRTFVKSLATIKNRATENMGGIPTLIGEAGIPYDMKDGAAYRTGDFSLQVKALDASMQALEANLLSFTLWNYTADNTNERGDQWNGEDFSIFSRDQQSDPADIHSGGRALEAVVRPYARKTAGEPLRMAFDIRQHLFEFEFRHDPAAGGPTEIFVPNIHYPRGYVVEVSDGTYMVDRAGQTLTYRHSTEQDIHHIRVRRPR